MERSGASMRVSKQFTFDEDEVREWCNKAGDSNDIHLNEDALSDNPFFDERVVPGMMLLDKVSGLITQWSETQGDDVTPVISRMSNTVFHEPVYFDEEIQVAIEQEDAEDDMRILRFEVTDSVAAEPRTQGYVTVYLL